MWPRSLYNIAWSNPARGDNSRRVEDVDASERRCNKERCWGQRWVRVRPLSLVHVILPARARAKRFKSLSLEIHILRFLKSKFCRRHPRYLASIFTVCNIGRLEIHHNVFPLKKQKTKATSKNKELNQKLPQKTKSRFCVVTLSWFYSVHVNALKLNRVSQNLINEDCISPWWPENEIIKHRLEAAYRDCWKVVGVGISPVCGKNNATVRCISHINSSEA